AIQSRLKELRIELLDQVNECQDFEDDPGSFDLTAFSTLQRQAERCCWELVTIFDGIRVRLQEAEEQVNVVEVPEPEGQDDNQMSDMRKEAFRRKAVPPPSPQRPAGPPEPVKPKSPWSLGGTAQFDIALKLSPPLSASPRQPSHDISPVSAPSSSQVRLIPRDVVTSRVTTNDDFLERRRRSRIIFQEEFRRSGYSFDEGASETLSAVSPMKSMKSMKSISSIHEHRASEGFSDVSLMSPMQIVSPTSRTSGSSGYEDLMTRKRSQGQSSLGTMSSTSSSLIQERQERKRQGSQDSIFNLRGAPLSPPLSEHRLSGKEKDSWNSKTLASTLRVPGFGSDVVDGLEVVSPVDHSSGLILPPAEGLILPSAEGLMLSHDEGLIPRHDAGLIVNTESANGLMLADEQHEPQHPTPTASIQSIDYPIRHDSSFYKFGGFCEGAKSMMRGEAGFKVVKRPSAGQGHYSATISARCLKCSYEVGWNDVEKDRLLDRAGIYENSGIRWRQKFISKCHVKTNSVDEPYYACIFCIEEHKTVEEHDATVFFSVNQLFRHLARHSRPLPNVAGMVVLYGEQPLSALDFDVHFISNEPKLARFNMSEIAHKVATRPSAFASITHNPKPKNATAHDPDGNVTMRFAAGARIVGIEFPDRFGGQFGIGYHDGEEGTFPSNAITLSLPLRDDVLMNSASTLMCTAKWDFKPKDAKEGGWLKFSKGDKISAVSYPFQDHWCWSGSLKGKWGLFPQSFVEGLNEAGKAGSPVAKSGLATLGSRMLKRRASKVTNPSVKSGWSSENGGRGTLGGHMLATQGQPGLEVVTDVQDEGGVWRT
ncbi:hypothetical protein B7494_g6635, partial [Chlorociboria aeruginascens]